jgi:hypothetical protein
MDCHDIMSVLSIPHQKKRFLPHIGGVRIVSGNSLNHMVSSNNMTYETWLMYLQKSTIYIHTHTSPLIPQVAPTCLTVYVQRCIRYKNIFTS